MKDVSMSLLSIQTIKAEREDELLKKVKEILPSSMDVDFVLLPKENNPSLYLFSVTVTNTFTESKSKNPMFRLITKSWFQFTCEPDAFKLPITDSNSPALIQSTVLAIAHNHGILSGITVGTPLYDQKIFFSFPENEIRDILKSRLNRDMN